MIESSEPEPPQQKAWTDDHIEEMFSSPAYAKCRQEWAKYSDLDHQNADGSLWQKTPIKGRDWTIESVALPALQCGGVCEAPPELCGNFIFRRWNAGQAGVFNHAKLRLAPDGTVPSMLDRPALFQSTVQRITLHQMVHKSEEAHRFLAAATFVPPSDTTDWLILGLGHGLRADFVHWATPWRVDFVEIDAKVLEVAQQYFGFPTLPRGGSHGGASNEQCVKDGRICVTIQDAFDHVEMLAASGRRYGLLYVDIAKPMFALWSAEKLTRFMSAVHAVSDVVVLNPQDETLLKPAVTLMRQFYERVACLPLPHDDSRKCFALGLGRHALSEDSAIAHAKVQDAQMSWAPFSLATFMQDKTFLVDPAVAMLGSIS